MQDARATRKDIYPIGKKNPNLPFHPAVRAGDFIFVSGQVAKDADGNMIAGTIEEETRVFGEHFKDAVLARTTVEARAVINTKIEMDAIAYKPRGGRTGVLRGEPVV